NPENSEVPEPMKCSIDTHSYLQFLSTTKYSNSSSSDTLQENPEPKLTHNLSASTILNYLSNILYVTTPENKNLWLSIIEKTGDSIINILTMTDENNRNVWISWLKEQCSSLDQLSKDLINDIEAKILKMENKNY
ncbi:unnamed protein product, partial [Brachionus calyciflorus]